MTGLPGAPPATSTEAWFKRSDKHTSHSLGCRASSGWSSVLFTEQVHTEKLQDLLRLIVCNSRSPSTSRQLKTRIMGRRTVAVLRRHAKTSLLKSAIKVESILIESRLELATSWISTHETTLVNSMANSQIIPPQDAIDSAPSWGCLGCSLDQESFHKR